MFSNKRNLQK